MIKKRILLLLAIGMCVAALSACSQQGSGESKTPGHSADVASGSTQDETGYPVSLTVYDDQGKKVQQTIEKEPERVVVIGQGLAELMIHFGEEDKIVGLAYLDQSYSKYEDQIKKLPILSDLWPSKEAVLALKPDLIVAMSSAFHDDRLGDISFWNQRGIPVVTGINYTIGRSIDSFYDDIRNLGTAFQAEDKTNAFIQDQQTRIKQIQEKAAKAERKPRVLLFAGGQNNTYYYYGPSLCLVDEMVEGSGGEYIKASNDTSMELSTESLLALNPDKIILTEFRKSEGDTEKDKLLHDPALQTVTAIQSGDIITVDYTNAVRGSTDLADTYQEVAKFVHPELFKGASK